MRRIDLTGYPIRGGTGDEGMYDVKQSLRVALTSPQLQLTGLELLEHHELAERIGQADGEVLLENAEWEKLHDVFKNRLRGFSINDVELVRRIIHAPKVPVEVKK